MAGGKSRSRSRLRVGGEPAEEGISPSVAGQGAEPRGGLAGDRFGGRGRRARRARAAGAGPVLERSGPCPAWGAWRASGWPAVGRAAECGAASGVVAPRLRQTGVRAPTPKLNRSDWVMPLTVLKAFSGESDARPRLKPSPRGSLSVRGNPRLASAGGSSALGV